MKDLKIGVIRNKKEYAQILKVRKVVFVKEQKVPLSLEIDEHEKSSKHVIVFLKSKSIGCARIRTAGKNIKLERIALYKKYRGRGIGNEVMKYLICYCKKKKPMEIYMHAQKYLIKFYEKFGFRRRGKVFEEAGIDHVEMYLKP